MTILVLGASGPIGAAISATLSAANQPYLAVSRQAFGPNTARADRSDADRIGQLIEDYGITTVVDVIAYTEADTLPLLKAIDGKLQRYVMLSSADVYKNYGLLHRLETGLPTPVLTEDAPLRSSRYPYRKSDPRTTDDPDKWMDAYDKIPLEAAVRDLSTDWTILRLPMVYGASGKLARFSWITRPMRTGKSKLEVARNWYNWTTTYGFVGNVAAAIVHVVTHPGAANETFNVTDTDAMAHSDWIDAFACAAGWRGEIDNDAHSSPGVAALDLSIPLVLIGDKLSARTGFVPPYSLASSIANVLEQTT